MVRLAESKCIAAVLPRVRDCRTGVDLVAGYTQLRYLHAFHSFICLLGSVLSTLGVDLCCSSGEAELGQGLASGEAPAATAAVLAILRVGVIEQLGEGGQVRLLTMAWRPAAGAAALKCSSETVRAQLVVRRVSVWLHKDGGGV